MWSPGNQVVRQQIQEKDTRFKKKDAGCDGKDEEHREMQSEENEGK